MIVPNGITVPVRNGTVVRDFGTILFSSVRGTKLFGSVRGTKFWYETQYNITVSKSVSQITEPRTNYEPSDRTEPNQIRTGSTINSC